MPRTGSLPKEPPCDRRVTVGAATGARIIPQGKLYLVFEYMPKNLLEILEEKPGGPCVGLPLHASS